MHTGVWLAIQSMGSQESEATEQLNHHHDHLLSSSAWFYGLFYNKSPSHEIQFRNIIDSPRILTESCVEAA